MITRPIRSSVLVLQREALTSPIATVLPTFAISWHTAKYLASKKINIFLYVSLRQNTTNSLSWQHCVIRWML